MTVDTNIKTLPQSEIDQMIAMFSTGRYVEMEAISRTRIETFPKTGFLWKIFGCQPVGSGQRLLVGLTEGR